MKTLHWAMKTLYWAMKSLHWVMKTLHWAMKIYHWVLKDLLWIMSRLHWTLKNLLQTMNVILCNEKLHRAMKNYIRQERVLKSFVLLLMVIIFRNMFDTHIII